MAVNIAINGFGRVGRLVFSKLLGDKTFEIAAINDSVKPDILAYLLKYETSQGFPPNLVDSGPDFISLRGKKIKVFAETDPAGLPWKRLKVDVVLDCTGRAALKEQAAAHLAAGAKKVLLTPPAVDYTAYTGLDTPFPAIVYGINEKTIAPADRIVFAASPALSSLAPLVKALNAFAPIQSAIINAEKGAGGMDGKAVAAALGRLFPELQGRLAGSALALGTGSAALIAAVVKGRHISPETLNRALNTQGGSPGPVIPVGEELFQVQIAAPCDTEASYAVQVVKTLKYFAELKAGPARPGAKAPAAKPAVGGNSAAKPGALKPIVPGTTKSRAAKKGEKPAGGAKPADPALPRKPLINFPK